MRRKLGRYLFRGSANTSAGAFREAELTEREAKEEQETELKEIVIHGAPGATRCELLPDSSWPLSFALLKVI